LIYNDQVTQRTAAIKKFSIWLLILVLTSFISFLAAYFYLKADAPSNLLKPKLDSVNQQKELPLLAYSIENLNKLASEATAPIQAKEIISKDLEKQVYVLLFSYQSQGKNISGALNVKITDDNSTEKMPVILMLRGYAPLDGYYSGEGTKNVAAVFADNNYVTLAPDFLGYGQSDSEPNNTWEARFIKPLNVIDLIKTIQKFPEVDLSLITDLPIKKISLDADRIGLWGHSNGGQIAVSTLEALESNLPTTLWAPVLAPFPYSILYFTDENADEGKEIRKYLSQFEEDYNVFDFSITQHLDRLYGPIQIQHGTDDDSALVEWSEEFLAKIDLENAIREASNSTNVQGVKNDLDATIVNTDTNVSASTGAGVDADVGASTDASTSAKKALIKIDFYKYPAANHNLQPYWNEAVQKDLDFFEQNL